MYGIEKSKKAIESLTDLIERGEIVFKDGKITWIEGIGSIKEFKNFLTSLLDMSDIIKEAKDYNEDERTQLIEFVKNKLDLDDNKAESIIEHLFQISLGVSGMVQLISDKTVGGGGPGGDPS